MFEVPLIIIVPGVVDVGDVQVIVTLGLFKFAVKSRVWLFDEASNCILSGPVGNCEAQLLQVEFILGSRILKLL